MPEWLLALGRILLRYWWIVALAVLAVLLVTLGPAACNKYRAMRAQNKVTQAQMGALTNSASDAVQTQSQANQNEQASEALTRSNDKEIRNAPGANDAVNPAVRDAGLHALCRRPAYRDTERCRLLATPAK